MGEATDIQAAARDGVVVVGAGQAGAATILRLRANGFAGPITLIGAEAEPPYQRPPLSKKFLTGEYAKDRLFLRPLAAYAQLDVTLMLGREVCRIDRSNHSVELDDGSTLPYGRLVLSTGARPRPLPETLRGAFENIYLFRTFADTQRLQAEMMPGRRILVVGGGYIGLETAAVARQLGLEVVLVEQADRILQRVASDETSSHFRNLHRSEGVRVLEANRLLALDGTGGRATRAVLSGEGEVEFDFAVVGIGVSVNGELAEDAGLEVDGGIVVDSQCRTADPAIFAVGDCTSFPYQGGRTRLESVHNAIAQGELVADVVAGKDVGPYAPVPWFWSDQFSTKLQIAGLNAGYDRVVRRPGGREDSLSVWYFRDEALIAVDAINDARAYMTGKRWLEAGLTPKAAAIADPAVDLKAAS
jgi:3-phenylpropionate/trans-cinnamate dioxygenase ferredoxin reductase subunit